VGRPRDIFHLVYTFSDAADPIRPNAGRNIIFDSIYLGHGGWVSFIQQEFRSLMLEIWRVKYLQMPRFGEVMPSIRIEIRLEHFLNDFGDSPDIQSRFTSEYLNQIRDLAREKSAQLVALRCRLLRKVRRPYHPGICCKK